jgi:diacylglycerol O-acyltransferase
MSSTTFDATPYRRVNDVVLAIIGGALRRYLLRRRSLPISPLQAIMPVSTRDNHSATGGNRLSAFIRHQHR